MKRNSADYVLLEEVLRRALDEASELAAKAARSDREEGGLFAYFNILVWAKQQAEILGIRFQDEAIRELDPYRLIGGQRDAA
ncbi:MAG: hypothetical protein M3495_01150 [Pseudomonadota bacterium]|nr:hypothetical protein [Gammaproteobacteria bacterium]MDQ3580305.1 hypothetical protein [Pseudomonadota bacterium]